MNQLAQTLAPVADVAAVDHGAHARHEPAVAPGAERLQVEVRRGERAAGQQVDLVADVGRPPGLAIGVDLVRQAGEFLERLRAIDSLDPYVSGGAHRLRTLALPARG